MKTVQTFRATIFLAGLLALMTTGCRETPVAEAEKAPLWTPFDETAELQANAEHENRRMRYKLIQSQVTDKNDIFAPMAETAMALGESRYEALRGLILGHSIPELQARIGQGEFTYEELTRFFLYRIYRYELDRETYLNTILALNTEAVQAARRADSLLKASPDTPRHPIFGMPVLLKDNIDTEGMPTTAGAVALQDHRPQDAFIVKQLKAKGAIILGKVNLSEWAYYFCSGCPVGYSAIGGQTLNPYGPRQFETGGSSSGSGTSMAAAYAVAAVGTETSGSILSPSGQNSVVGLKPTVGVLSRSGIVPISSTLDTPGPMTRSVVDNGILLSAMMGFDEEDPKSVNAQWEGTWYLPDSVSLKGRRFGAFKGLLESDSLYRQAVGQLEAAGAEVIAFEPPEVDLEGFLPLLNGDMRVDLPHYLETRVVDTQAVQVRSVADVVAFNLQDTLVRAPYGQGRLEGILADSTDAAGLQQIKARMQQAGRQYFDEAFQAHNLDAILSVNNYHAGYAAVALYPALGVPMGYRDNGEPANLTFIAKRYQEPELLQFGAGFEAVSQARQMPEAYQD
ncbi:amidase family protein [Robiginitalea sp. M366]|uniref:amidase family protein n=1 Tax=Robiginitalea aestuariiviva TaxID=3036903 RepID=UPI00240CF045|nr:amidase family protein [Robiginitalea aestuariiviva]MDG1573215.1 amidase family protein [Robiginitalea aestuariiviva]